MHPGALRCLHGEREQVLLHQLNHSATSTAIQGFLEEKRKGSIPAQTPVAAPANELVSCLRIATVTASKTGPGCVRTVAMQGFLGEKKEGSIRGSSLEILREE